MGTKFEVDNTGNVDVKNNLVSNAERVGYENLASDPSSPVEGQTYYNSTSKKLRVYNGTTWVNIGSDTSLLPTSSSGVARSYKHPDVNVFFIGTGCTHDPTSFDGGSTSPSTLPGGLFWPKAGGTGFGSCGGQWCFGILATANVAGLWTYSIGPSNIPSQINFTGSYSLLDFNIKDHGLTPGDVVIRMEESVASLTSVNPEGGGFAAFGVLYTTAEFDSYSDGTARGAMSFVNNSRFSQYIAQVSNITKPVIAGLMSSATGPVAFGSNRSDIYLWNFNTNTWDNTIATFAAGYATSGGNAGSAASVQNNIAAITAADSTNYVSGGVAYVRVTASCNASASSGGTTNIGYIGLVEANEAKKG